MINFGTQPARISSVVIQYTRRNVYIYNRSLAIASLVSQNNLSASFLACMIAHLDFVAATKKVRLAADFTATCVYLVVRLRQCFICDLPAKWNCRKATNFSRTSYLYYVLAIDRQHPDSMEYISMKTSLSRCEKWS